MHDQGPAWAGLLASLRRLDDVRLVHSAAGDATLPTDLEVGIEVLLLSMGLSERHGRAAIAGFVAGARPARTIMVASEPGTEHALRSAHLGALGVLSLAETPERFRQAIHCVRSGQTWFGRRVEARLLETVCTRRETAAAEAHDPSAHLSSRERDVVGLLAMGMKNRQIAERLFISEVTVRHHLTRIYRKLGVTSRHSLALYVHKAGLTDGGSPPTPTRRVPKHPV
jgi:DNA-binding NarL/FixJ family response regulator